MLCFCGGESFFVEIPRRCRTQTHLSFPLFFRFPRVLRVQENVQVANGAESTREGGVRQGVVHLSVLPQYHAHEVQPGEPPEEGARLCAQDLKQKEE